MDTPTENPKAIRKADEIIERKHDIDHRWEIGPSQDEKGGTEYVVVSIHYWQERRRYWASINKQCFTPIGMNCFPADAVTLGYSMPVVRHSPKALREYEEQTIHTLAQRIADRRTAATYDSERENLDTWLAVLTRES